MMFLIRRTRRHSSSSAAPLIDRLWSIKSVFLEVSLVVIGFTKQATATAQTRRHIYKWHHTLSTADTDVDGAVPDRTCRPLIRKFIPVTWEGSKDFSSVFIRSRFAAVMIGLIQTFLKLNGISCGLIIENGIAALHCLSKLFVNRCNYMDDGFVFICTAPVGLVVFWLRLRVRINSRLPAISRDRLFPLEPFRLVIPGRTVSAPNSISE